jgi:hypothetical protein
MNALLLEITYPSQVPRGSGSALRSNRAFRPQRRHAFKIGLLLIPLICGMTVHPGFAKGGKSTGHAYVAALGDQCQAGAPWWESRAGKD